jgi:hypothetical protein
MRRAALAATCVLAAVATAAEVPKFALPAADEKDVIGRPVAAAFTRRQPVLLLYANQQTQHDTDEPATNFAVRLGDVPMVVLVRVDLRDVFGMFHFFARQVMKSRHAASLKDYAARAQALGRTPPANGAEGLYIVADEKGLSHAAVGLPKGFTTPLAVVLGPDGTELARGAFPADAARLEAAIRSSAGR